MKLQFLFLLWLYLSDFKPNIFIHSGKGIGTKPTWGVTHETSSALKILYKVLRADPALPAFLKGNLWQQGHAAILGSAGYH